jgi:hypothetical protein
VSEIKKLSGTSWNEKRIKTYIEDKIECSEKYILRDNEDVVNIKNLYEGASFRIRLSTIEFEEKSLILCDQFVPFDLLDVSPYEYKLIDSKGNKFSKMDKDYDKEKFFPFYYLKQELLESDKLKSLPNARIVLPTFDLSAWMKLHDFKIDDSIIVKIIDIEKHIFELNYESSLDCKKDVFLVRENEKNLSQVMQEILRDELLNIPELFLEAILKLNIDLTKPFMQFFKEYIIRSEIFSLATFSGEPIIVAEDSLFIKRFGSQESLPEIDDDDYDLDYMLETLQIPYTKNFIFAYMRCMIAGSPEGYIPEDLLEILFYENENFFESDSEQSFFINELNEMAEIADDMEADKPLSGKQLFLLNNLIDKKIRIAEIKAKSNLPDSEIMNISALTELFELELHVDDIIDKILDKPQLPKSDITFAYNLIENVTELLAKFLDTSE